MARTHENYTITVEEKQALDALLRSPKTAQSLAARAKIILLTASGKKAEEVAAELGTTERKVYRWRKRFKEQSLHGLQDLPRSGQPKKLSEKMIKEVLQMTVERIPREATHWSVRLMAKAARITTWQVRQIWEAADLKPHRIKTFKISNDPHFADKVVDVVGLYMNPPDNAMILSVDEKTQIQALDRTQPMLPLKPGQIERRTHDYKRNGTTNLYAAFDVLTGKVIGRTTKKHRAKEFLAFLRQIDREMPQDLDLHIILDNSSTHKTPEVKKWLTVHPRFIMHFTPTSASWLNAVEGWFAQLERRSVHRGVFSNVKELRDEIHRFIRVHNSSSAKPFKWTKNAKSIIDSVERAKQSLNDDTNQTVH
jgi:transposase